MTTNWPYPDKAAVDLLRLECSRIADNLISELRQLGHIPVVTFDMLRDPIVLPKYIEGMKGQAIDIQDLSVMHLAQRARERYAAAIDVQAKHC